MEKTKDLFSFEHSIAGQWLDQFEYPWQALQEIGSMIESIQKTLSQEEYNELEPGVFVHKRAKVFPSAYLGSPCIVMEDAEIRHCAFVRGNALIGKKCVVGNSTELKNVLLFDEVQVPHYNYVGDSILGYKAHMGAGSVTSNVKGDKSLVQVKDGLHIIDTGLKKFGAILGDGVEIGCNSVLNPGTVIGKESSIYPLSNVRGVIKANSIYKKQGEVVLKHKRR